MFGHVGLQLTDVEGLGSGDLDLSAGCNLFGRRRSGGLKSNPKNSSSQALQNASIEESTWAQITSFQVLGSLGP